MPTDPFVCQACGSQGFVLPAASERNLIGSLVVGLDPECEGCQTAALDAGAVFPPRFGQPPLGDL